MFVKIDKKTLVEEIINSEEMVDVLERDLKPAVVDDTLMDMVSGTYEHSNAFAIYKYKRMPQQKPIEDKLPPEAES